MGPVISGATVFPIGVIVPRAAPVALAFPKVVDAVIEIDIEDAKSELVKV
jgi:hypothetical protein